MTTDDGGDDGLASRIESRLMSHGVYADEVIEDGDGYRLTYESVAADGAEAVPHQEVGRVINVFRDLHDDGWEGADIEATVTDLEGDELGEWHVEQEWIGALHDGDLSEVEFSQRVIETIETPGDR